MIMKYTKIVGSAFMAAFFLLGCVGCSMVQWSIPIGKEGKYGIFKIGVGYDMPAQEHKSFTLHEK